MISGDPESPTSRGYLCPKGAAAPEILYHKDRLTHPLRRAGARGGNKWERISWKEAISEMVERMDRIRIDLSSPQAMGMDMTEYQEMGQLAREGLEVLKDAPAQRRAVLLEMSAFADFLVEQMARFEQDWKERRTALVAAGELPPEVGGGGHR